MGSGISDLQNSANKPAFPKLILSVFENEDPSTEDLQRLQLFCQDVSQLSMEQIDHYPADGSLNDKLSYLISDASLSLQWGECKKLWENFLVHLESLDPWKNKSVEDQLMEINEDALVFIDSVDDLESGEEQLVRIQSSENILNNLTIFTQAKIMAADMSNSIDLSLNEIHAYFVRDLNLSGSKLVNGCNFATFPHLLVLDLSYIDDESFWESNIDLSQLQNRLKKFVADGCELTEVPKCLNVLKVLSIISLQENAITQLDSSTVFQSCRNSVRELDLRENDVTTLVTKKKYDEMIKSLFPNIIMLDNRLLNEKGAGMNLQHIPGLQDAMVRTDTVIDQNEDRGNCSCLEGNPCLSSYTCKDWKNRFKIAELCKQVPLVEKST